MITLPANGACPRCGVRVWDVIYERTRNPDEAVAVYECPRCGTVHDKTVSISADSPTDGMYIRARRPRRGRQQEKTMDEKKTYQGQKVTVVRAARQGDQGFDPSKDKSLIRLDDGTEKVVNSNEIT